MRIEITRTGGFGGLTRTWSLEVSRTEAEQRWLPLAEAQADTADVRDARTDDAAEDDHAGRTGTSLQRDRFTYRIAIGYTEVHLPESRLEDPWRELIQRARESAAPPAPSAGTAAARTPEEPGGQGPEDGAGEAGPDPSGPGARHGGDAGPGKTEELL